MSKKQSFEEVDSARKVLELGETATRKEIDGHYKRLIKKYHPDTCGENKDICLEKTREIQAAYSVLKDYIEQYRYSFIQTDNNSDKSAEEFWKKRFGQDPVWG